MKLPGPLLLALLPALLAAAVPPASIAPAAVAQPAATAPPPPDYTTQAGDPPLVPEYDPASAPPPPYAEAPDDDGMRQCVGPDGVPIFTDRRCADLGAVPRVAPPAGGDATAAGLPLRVRTCARNQAMLLDGVRAALESHDANRLADYYHWSGMDSAQGYRLMERLGAFSARPVVDVQLVRAAPAEVPDPYENRFDPLPRPPPPDADSSAGGDPEATEGTAPPRPHRRPLASLLRVDQMRGENDVAATVTYFHLLTNAGCWWMRF